MKIIIVARNTSTSGGFTPTPDDQMATGMVSRARRMVEILPVNPKYSSVRMRGKAVCAERTAMLNPRHACST